MRVIEYLIDKTGTLIFPTVVQKASIDYITTGNFYNQITCTFYNNIQTDSSGIITPINPVITGLSGTITLQAKPNDDSAWSNIQNGLLDLSTGANMAFPSGVIRSINAVCTGITGCNYILIRLDRGI